MGQTLAGLVLFKEKPVSLVTITNVAYGLLTVRGLLNIKTNALKCSIIGIFLIKGITQHFFYSSF